MIYIISITMRTIIFKKVLIAMVFFLLMATHSLSKKCGKEGRSKRISGGSFAKPYQYPWMVSFSRFIKGKQYYCGGTLISDRLVLTAKHCTTKMDHWGKAKVGTHSSTHPTDYQRVEFKRAILHRTTHPNDIAILLLKIPVDLRDPKIGIICLPQSKNEEYIGENVKSMGWGMEGFKKWGEFLKTVDLEVDKKQEKYWLYTKVKQKNGVYQDACAGDSGSPLMYKKDDQWTIIATVNGRGYDCRSGKVKGLGKWNKITDHLKWIKKVMKKYNGDSSDYGERASSPGEKGHHTDSKISQATPTSFKQHPEGKSYHGHYSSINPHQFFKLRSPHDPNGAYGSDYTTKPFQAIATYKWMQVKKNVPKPEHSNGFGHQAPQRRFSKGSSGDQSNSRNNIDDYIVGNKKIKAGEYKDDYIVAGKKSKNVNYEDDYVVGGKKSKAGENEDDYVVSTKKTKAGDYEDDYVVGGKKAKAGDYEDDYIVSGKKAKAGDYGDEKGKLSDYKDDYIVGGKKAKASDYEEDYIVGGKKAKAG